MAPATHTTKNDRTSREGQLHERLLDAGWSPDEIATIESLMLRLRLSERYLAAGYSPGDLDALSRLG